MPIYQACISLAAASVESWLLLQARLDKLISEQKDIKDAEKNLSETVHSLLWAQAY